MNPKHSGMLSSAAFFIALVTSAFAQEAAPREKSLADNTTSNSIAVVRSGNYYEDHAAFSCDKNFVNCFLTFTQTPADKFLTITNISCSTQSTNIPGILYLSFSSTAGNTPGRQTFLPIAPVAYVRAVFGSDYVYTLSFNIPIKFKMGVSKEPYVNFYQIGSVATTTFTINCTITGELSDPAF